MYTRAGRMGDKGEVKTEFETNTGPVATTLRCNL